MKAIGHIRVSTEEQSADDKYGIEVQKQAISDYADRNDFEIVCWLTGYNQRCEGQPPGTGQDSLQCRPAPGI